MKVHITVIICVALLATGLAFVRISQNQHQSNDQSQNTVVNTITKTVVVNVPREKKYRNIKWVRSDSFQYTKAFSFFEDLNEWQKQNAKVIVHNGTFEFWYPTVNETPIVFTNEKAITNNSKTMSTNTSEISNPLLKKIKGWFK